MQSWQLQEAKAKFSEVIETAEKKGPQMITRRGVETAVIIPIEEWHRLKPMDNHTLLKLLQSGPDMELPLPPRGRFKHRKPITL